MVLERCWNGKKERVVKGRNRRGLYTRVFWLRLQGDVLTIEVLILYFYLQRVFKDGSSSTWRRSVLKLNAYSFKYWWLWVEMEGWKTFDRPYVQIDQ